MGFFSNSNETQMRSKTANPAVAECAKKLNELESQRKQLLLAIGTRYFEEHKEDTDGDPSYTADIKKIISIEQETVIVEMRKLALQGLRKCTACGNMLPLDSLFCNKCGEKQQLLNITETMNSNVCPNCGAEREEGNVFCTVCGFKLID